MAFVANFVTEQNFKFTLNFVTVLVSRPIRSLAFLNVEQTRQIPVQETIVMSNTVTTVVRSGFWDKIFHGYDREYYYAVQMQGNCSLHSEYDILQKMKAHTLLTFIAS